MLRPGRVLDGVGLAQRLPAGAGDVGSKGVEHLRQGDGRLAQHRCALAGGIHLVEQVGQFHHRRNRGVEGLPAVDVVGDLGDGLVQLAPRLDGRDTTLPGRFTGDHRLHQTPVPSQKAAGALQPGI